MKITIIGAGSFFFTRQILKRLSGSPYFAGAEVALVDIHEGRLNRIGLYAQKFAKETGSHFTVSYTANRLEALENSDYVILTFAANNVHSRGVGAHICMNYGVREYSGDTAGPGSVMRIIREIPEVLAVAKDVERLCPDAMVINYVNPTNVVTAALKRYTKVNCIGFCDGMHLPYFAPKILNYVGEEASKENIAGLDLRISGINHFGWMTGLTLHGKDHWTPFKAGVMAAVETSAKEAPHLQAEAELLETMDAWPTCIFHGAEYVRYFQGRGSRPERDFVIKPWSLPARIKMMREFWRNVDAYNAGTMGRESAFKDRLDDGEMIGDVIESIEGNLAHRFPINVVNNGQVANLPDDCIVELFGTLDKAGVHISSAPPLPRGPLGMTHAVLDQQELALEAAMTGDVDILVRAIACDPLVMSLSDARDITRELMAAEEEFLDARWDGFWK